MTFKASWTLMRCSDTKPGSSSISDSVFAFFLACAFLLAFGAMAAAAKPAGAAEAAAMKMKQSKFEELVQTQPDQLHKRVKLRAANTEGQRAEKNAIKVFKCVCSVFSSVQTHVNTYNVAIDI